MIAQLIEIDPVMFVPRQMPNIYLFVYQQNKLICKLLMRSFLIQWVYDYKCLDR